MEEILKKESWTESDIKVLIENKQILPESALVKLGLSVATQPAPEEIQEEVVVKKAKKKL